MHVGEWWSSIDGAFTISPPPWKLESIACPGVFLSVDFVCVCVCFVNVVVLNYTWRAEECYSRMCNFVIQSVIESPVSSAGLDRPLSARCNGLFVFWLPLNTIISIHKWDIASSCLLVCAYSHSPLFHSHYLNLAHTQTSPSTFVSWLLLHTCPLCLICRFLAAFANLGIWKFVFSGVFSIRMCKEAVIARLKLNNHLVTPGSIL